MEKDDNILPAFVRKDGARLRDGEEDSGRSGRLPAVGRNGVPYCLSNEGFHRDIGVSAELGALRRGIAPYRSKADVLIVVGRLAVLTIPTFKA